MTLATAVYVIFAQAIPFVSELKLVPEGPGTVVEWGETYAQTTLSDVFGPKWLPGSDVQGFFGMVPMIVATIVVTLGSMALAIPFGLSVAVFVGQISPRYVEDVFEVVLELLLSRWHLSSTASSA